MRPQEAFVEVFWTAFKSMTKAEREALVARLLRDPEFREDLLDLALIEEARREEGEDVPLDVYRKQRQRRRDV